MEKIKNPLYMKIKTNIVVDAKKEMIKNFSDSSSKEKKNKFENKNDQTQGRANNKQISIDTSLALPRTNHSKSVKNNLKNENLKELIPIEYDYSTLLPRGKTLRTSTPYRNNSKREYEENLKNKEKWLIKKGFEVNFGKLDFEKKSIIPNYVFMSSPKIPIFKHKFREVNKDKWINKNSFFYKNSHDLVI